MLHPLTPLQHFQTFPLHLNKQHIHDSTNITKRTSNRIHIKENKENVPPPSYFPAPSSISPAKPPLAILLPASPAKKRLNLSAPFSPPLVKSIVDIPKPPSPLQTAPVRYQGPYLDCLYEGYWLNGHPHGKGKLIFSTGIIVKTTFINGAYGNDGTIIWPNIGIYEGALVDGKPHGLGTLIFKSGIKYTGAFANGSMHGKGVLICNETTYSGEMKNNLRDGKGILTRANGDTFEGLWANDLKHGKGILTLTSRKYVQEGEWKNNRPDGLFRAKKPNGNIITGVYSQGTIRGNITETTPKGDTLEIGFVDGKKHGKGFYTVAATKTKQEVEYRHGKLVVDLPDDVEAMFALTEKDREDIAYFESHAQLIHSAYTFPNGDTYTGYWFNSQPHGKGHLRYSNGDVFKGEFHEGLPIYGILKYHYDQTYEGPFAFGLPHTSQGGKITSNGHTYIGGVFLGEADGKGIVKKNNGDIFEMVFRYGPQPKGTIRYSNGAIYQGEIKKFLASGIGKLIYAPEDPSDPKLTFRSAADLLRSSPIQNMGYAHKKTCEGEFVKGFPNGKVKIVFVNGDVYMGMVKNGIPHGKGTFINDSGTLEANFEEGVAQGYGIFSGKNGERYEGEYRDGLKHGSGKLYFANGDIYEGDFVENEPHGDGELTRSDGSCLTGTWHCGNPPEEAVIKYGDGTYFEGSTNSEGERHGKGSTSFPDGSIECGTYRNDAWVESDPNEIDEFDPIESQSPPSTKMDVAKS